MQLDLSRQGLIKVPVIASNVTNLILTGNPGIDLSTIPTGIVSLDISECALTSLVGLPNTIRYLRCSKNKIRTLEPLREIPLVSLGCSYNYLSSLQGCPSTVRSMVCVSNWLENLDGLPSVMDKLYISYNCLQEIQTPPVRILDCSCNKLTTLRGIGPVEELTCSYNRLSDVIGCPPEVKILQVSGNPLQKITILPPGLQVFECLNVALNPYPEALLRNIPEVFTDQVKRSG